MTNHEHTEGSLAETRAPAQAESDERMAGVRESLRRYVDGAVKPGSFLLAVLENDLRGAAICADSWSAANWREISHEVANTVPKELRGDAHRVHSYLLRHELARRGAELFPAGRGRL